MNSIGVDLHKHLITVCVINDEFVVIAEDPALYRA